MTTKNNKKTLSTLGRPESIICIDASTNSLAFSLFKEGELINYGKIKFAGTDAFHKAGDACRKSIPFFKKIEVDALVIESVIYSASPKTTINLALVQGAVVAAAQVAGIKIIHGVSPMSWQNHVGTKLLSAQEKQDIKLEDPGHSISWYKGKEREVRKNRTIDSVNNKYGICVDDNDVADAIAIGWFVYDKWSVVFNV